MIDTPREPPPAGARDLCLWLAVQAAHDAGLIKRLVHDYGSFEKVVRQPRRQLAAKVRDHAGAPAGSATMPGTGVDEAVVTWADDDYPRQLDDLYDPPPALFLRGARLRSLLRALSVRPTVAVVGARRPSPYGLEMAGLLGAGLVRAGVNVVSGVALGVDAAAQVEAVRQLADHRQAAGLRDVAGVARAGVPAVAVVGVLGGGVRLVAPRTNARLFDAIATHGLLLSEYGWDLPPAPWRFPARNRVIAALARATVIVEGRSTSGALHTAAFALDMGRDVLAVPGEAGRPLAAAPHKLLRDGAHLCESVDDVLALLPDGPWRHGLAGEDPAGVGAAAQVGDCGVAGLDESSPEGRVRAALERGPHTPDQLIESTHLAPQRVMAALSLLEIAGSAERMAGGRYRLARGSAP